MSEVSCCFKNKLPKQRYLAIRDGKMQGGMHDDIKIQCVNSMYIFTCACTLHANSSRAFLQESIEAHCFWVRGKPIDQDSEPHTH